MFLFASVNIRPTCGNYVKPDVTDNVQDPNHHYVRPCIIFLSAFVMYVVKILLCE